MLSQEDRDYFRQMVSFALVQDMKHTLTCRNQYEPMSQRWLDLDSQYKRQEKFFHEVQSSR